MIFLATISSERGNFGERKLKGKRKKAGVGVLGRKG
jgi:hypothetical protein